MAISLRLAGPQDAAAVASIYAPYVEGTDVTLEYDVPPAAEMARRMAEKAGLFPWLVAEDGDGTVLGYAYGGRLAARRGYDWVCEASIYMAQSAHRRGLGRALYTALLEVLAAQGYRSVVGILSIPNPASQRFHERMGFVSQGLLEDITYKFGRVRSVGYYVKHLHPAMESPPAPVPLSALAEGAVRAILDRAAQSIGVSSK